MASYRFYPACAERVALIAHSFGCPESQALFEQGLELAWLGTIHKGLSAQARQLIEEIENAPETGQDVPGAAYYAGKPLYLVEFALEVVVTSEVEPALRACAGGMDFRSELDSVLREESQRMRSFPPGEMPPAGPLEILEVKHQRQSLDLLKSAREPDAELISRLRQAAREANRDLELVVSEVGRVERE
jgi:hypothetical protein